MSASAGGGVGFESFSKKEKNVFMSLFGGSASESDEDEEVAEKQQSREGEEDKTEATTELKTESIYSSLYTSVYCLPEKVDVVLIERKQLGIAHQLWPAAKFLCDYFHRNPSELLNSAQVVDKNKQVLSILELGAGVGLCGMFVAQLLHQTHSINALITDLPEAMDGLNENIHRNNLEETVKARVLSWGVQNELDAVMDEFQGKIPLVIAADCVYWECLYEPLFITMRALIARGCKIIISHVRRWKKDGKFFAMCRKAGFSVTTLVEDVVMVPAEHTGVPTRQVTRIYCIAAAGYTPSTTPSDTPSDTPSFAISAPSASDGFT